MIALLWGIPFTLATSRFSSVPLAHTGLSCGWPFDILDHRGATSTSSSRTWWTLYFLLFAWAPGWSLALSVAPRPSSLSPNESSPTRGLSKGRGTVCCVVCIYLPHSGQCLQQVLLVASPRCYFIYPVTSAPSLYAALSECSEMWKAMRRHALFPLGAFMTHVYCWTTSSSICSLFLCTRCFVAPCPVAWTGVPQHILCFVSQLFLACLPRYTVVSFRVELCLFASVPSAWIQVSGKQLVLNKRVLSGTGLMVSQPLCVIFLLLKNVLMSLMSKAQSLEQEQLICICPTRYCTSGWETSKWTKDMLIRHADASAMAVNSAEQIN